MRGLKHRKNITSTVRKEAVRKAARELGITLRRYTIGALLDAGHNVGDEKPFYKSYINKIVSFWLFSYILCLNPKSS